jgi:CRISPR-associated protein Cas1
MNASLAAVADLGALTSAWQRVLANDRADDMLSAGVRRFEESADERLAQLSEQLHAGTYQPGTLRVVEIPKDDGELRVLLVPPVIDRIVERAALVALTPVVDPVLGPSSFGYRPGLGVVDAVQALAGLRDEGFGYVLRADVNDCFPSIDLRRVRRLIHHLVDDAPLIAVLDLLLDRRTHGAARRDGSGAPGGLPQGGPLSPLFANLVLEHLDERLRRAGFPLVRYGDDVAAAATTVEEAVEAGRIAAVAAEELDMDLGCADVMSFAEGFTFLGEDFGPRYPPVIDHRTEIPERRTVYLGVAGSRARIDEGRVVVHRDEEELLDVPAGLIARLVCFGPVAVSAGLRNWALSSGVEMVFCSQRGRYLGQIVSGHTDRVRRLRRQIELSASPDRYMPLARAIVEAKIRKQAVLLRHLMRKESACELAEAVGAMQGYADMLAEAGNRDDVMGLEGAAARAYFQAWVTTIDPAFRFTGRNRRPPLDVVNSALSFGYAVLLSEATSALAAAGLDPAIGLLHADADGRPSLALDLAEEFRPLIVDQVVMELLRRRRLTVDHGRADERSGGVLLTAAGRTSLLDAYERRMLRITKGSLPDFTGSMRRHLYRQAQVLAGCVEGTQPGYAGVSWR